MSFAEEALQGPTPAYTLFDANAVGLATLLGSPVAGTSLMAVNYRRLGQAGKALTAVIVGIAVTGLVILLTWNIPRGVTFPIALALVFAIKRSAQSLQGSALQKHTQEGGRLGSRWTAFKLGTGFLVGLVALVFLAVFIPSSMAQEPSVVIGSKDEVYYSGSATKEEAQSLGDALKKTGYFSDRGADVLLAKGKEGTTVSFIIKQGLWDQPGILSSFEEVGREVAPSIGGFPIQVRLMNKTREIEKQATIGRAAFAGDHVYYLGEASESQAQALGQSLKTAGFFEGRGTDVFLSKHGGGTLLSFVVGNGVWDDPALVGQFEKIVRQTSSSVGGLPVRLNLVNTTLEVKKDEVVK